MLHAERVHLAQADGVARLRMVRADARNAIDPAMVAGLKAAVEAVRADARVLLISADGPDFSVGGDLAHFEQAARDGGFGDAVEGMIGPFHETLARIWELPIPVVCAVQGAVAGGALGLCWVSDVVLAADDLKLATAFAAIGLSGDGASSWHLPRLAGVRRAHELLLEGRELNAAEALEWGLVTRVVPVAGLDGAAEQSATRLAAGSGPAQSAMKRLLRGAADRTLREHYTAELESMARLGAGPDAAEGIIAFAERRRPQFRTATSGDPAAPS